MFQMVQEMREFKNRRRSASSETHGDTLNQMKAGRGSSSGIDIASGTGSEVVAPDGLSSMELLGQYTNIKRKRGSVTEAKHVTTVSEE